MLLRGEGFMDIVKALRKEEAKLEKQAKNAAKHLAAIREAVKAFGGSLIGSTGRQKSTLSAAGRLAISKAAKTRWAKHRGAAKKKARGGRLGSWPNTTSMRRRRTISTAGRANIWRAAK